MKRIWKELDESNGDYKGTAAEKPHSDHSDNKRTPKFIAEIQAMIDNHPCKSIRSIEVSELLIRYGDIDIFPTKWERANF